MLNVNLKIKVRKAVLFLAVLSIVTTAGYAFDFILSTQNYSAKAQNNITNEIDTIQKLISDSQFNEAISKLKDLINSDPKNSKYHRLLGSIYQKMGNLDYALYEFDLSEHISLGNKIDLNVKKNATQQEKEGPAYIKPSIIDINNNQDDSDNNTKRMFAGAYGYYIQGKYDEAIEKYLSALKLDPNNYQGYFELGQVYQDIGDTQNAGTFYEKAISLSPEFVPAYKKLALIKATSGDIQKAIVLYEKLISFDANDSKTFYALSKLYKENNQLEKSYNALMNAYNIDPTNPKITNDLKSISSKIGKPLKPSINKELSKLSPNENVNDVLFKANSYLKNKDLENSIEYFKKVLLIDPNNSKAKVGLSSAMSIMAKDLSNKGYQDFSQQMFLKSLEYDPGNLQSIEYLAHSYISSKNYDSAEKYLEMYLNKSFNKDIAYNLADIYHNRRDSKSYIGELDEIYKIDNKYKDVAIKLANYYSSINDKERALVYFQQSFENNHSIDVAKKIADIYYKMGNLNNAKIYYDKALSINKSDFDSLKAKGMIELYLNNSNEALTYLNKAVSINNKDSQLFFEIAKIYQEKKDLSNALKNFNMTIQIDPKLSQAYYLAGMIYKNQNQTSLAKQYLSKVVILDPDNPDIDILLSELSTKQNNNLSNTSTIKDLAKNNNIIFQEDQPIQTSSSNVNTLKERIIPNYISKSSKETDFSDNKKETTISNFKTDLPKQIVNEPTMQKINMDEQLINQANQEADSKTVINSQASKPPLKSKIKIITSQPFQEDPNATITDSTTYNYHEDIKQKKANEKDSTSIPVFIADDEDYSEWGRNNVTYNKNANTKVELQAKKSIIDAEDALKTGNYLQTIDIVSDLIKDNPSEKAYYLLGKAYYHKKDYNMAIDNLKQATILNSNHNQYKILLAKALIKENYGLEALKILTNLPANDANNSEILNLVGDIYYSQNNYSEALVYYEKCLSLTPLTNETIVKLGNVYNKLSQYNDTIDLMLKSIASGYSSYDIYSNIVTAYKNLNNTNKAQFYLAKAEELEPDNPQNDILNSEIKELTINKNEWNSTKPTNKSNSTEDNQSISDSRYDNLTEAINKFNEIIKVNPDSIDAHYNLGCSYKKLGKYEEAIYYFKQALRLNPKDTDILVNLGTTYIETGNYSKASNTLYNAIQYDPNNATNYSLLGITYFKKGFYEDALKSFLRSTEIKGNSLSNLYNIGMCYTMLKDKKMAETYFQRALNLKPATMEDEMVLASIYKELSQYNKAKVIYDKLIREYPSRILPRYKLIQLYELTAKYNDMTKEIQNLLKIDSDSKLANLAKQKLQLIIGND